MAEAGFDVYFMEEVRAFLKGLALKDRKKITYNVRKVSSGHKDDELFRKLDGTDGFWEFRTIYNGLQYRLLAFWDETEKRLVVATHGFVKKTWAIPKKEIIKAEEQRRKYYESQKVI